MCNVRDGALLIGVTCIVSRPLKYVCVLIGRRILGGAILTTANVINHGWCSLAASAVSVATGNRLSRSVDCANSFVSP